MDDDDDPEILDALGLALEGPSVAEQLLLLEAGVVEEVVGGVEDPSPPGGWARRPP